MPDIRLDGKAAVVTGGGRGIGRAIALGLASAGAHVLVADLGVDLDGAGQSSDPANEVVDAIRQLGGRAEGCFETVTTVDGGARIIDAALESFGRLDILVAAAGIMIPATIFDMTETQWDRVIATNLKGHFTVVQAAARVMQSQKSGSIITMTSTGGLEGNPLQPNYSATKEGIVGLTRAVALQLAPYANCNAISPSGRSRMTSALPRAAGVPPEAEHVAPLAVFLSSEQGRRITGQVIAISGERIACYPQPRPYQTAYRTGGWTPETLDALWASSFKADELVRYSRYVNKDLTAVRAQAPSITSANPL